MAQIIQVLLYSTIFLSIKVTSQEPLDLTSPQLEETPNILDLVKLLRTAARLAYPITTGLNNVIGNLRDPKNNPSTSNYHYSYGRYPGYASKRRPNINRNKVGYLRVNSQDLRSVSGQDVNRRISYNPTIYNYDYDYEYEYDYDSQYLEYNDNSEVHDDFLFHDSGVQSVQESKGLNVNGAVLAIEPLESVPNSKLKPGSKKKGKLKAKTLKTNDEGLTVPQSRNKVRNRTPGINLPINNNDKAAVNVLPESNGGQPNVIYVVLNPGDIHPGMNEQNFNNLLKDQGLTLNEDGVPNTANGYYIIPANAVSSGRNVNNPFSLIPVNGTSIANAPVRFLPAATKARVN